MTPILQVEHLTHRYSATGPVVLSDLGLTLNSSEMVSISGESGSGKTTFLLACGAMQRPTDGTVKINGQDVFGLSRRAQNTFRAQQIGYVFQTLQLVPYLSVLHNLMIVRGVDLETARHRLEQLGVDPFRNRMPHALSQGQRQRVALARAMVHRPALLIADEPTGNLDATHSELVFRTLREFAENGGAVLLASHDPGVREISDRNLMLKDGNLILEERESTHLAQKSGV